MKQSVVLSMFFGLALLIPAAGCSGSATPTGGNAAQNADRVKELTKNAAGAKTTGGGRSGATTNTPVAPPPPNP